MGLISTASRVLSYALTLALGVGMLLGLYLWWASSWHIESTDNAYLKADLVNIAANVEGRVQTIPIVENRRVQAGEVLVTLDPDRARAQLDEARSMVEARRADVEAGKAAIAALKAQEDKQASIVNERRAAVEVGRTELSRRRDDFARARTLAESGSVSRRQRDSASADLAKAEAELAMARAAMEAAAGELPVLAAERKRADATLRGAEAILSEAIAARELAKITLAETAVRAPISGIVANLAAREGEHVQPGQTLMTLVPDAPYVVANFKETQIKRMRIGSPADISVDAFPDLRLTGVVDSFAPATGAEFSILPPQNATGNFTKIVQRIPVRIRLTNAQATDRRLAAGLSVVVRVDVGEPPEPAEKERAPATDVTREPLVSSANSKSRD